MDAFLVTAFISDRSRRFLEVAFMSDDNGCCFGFILVTAFEVMIV